MDNKDMQARIRQGRFVKNNGTILRAINIYRYKYLTLTDLRYAVELTIPETDLIDSVNYLYESDYIELRHTSTKADTSLADTPFEDLEAKLSAKGIQLLNGKVDDPCIDI